MFRKRYYTSVYRDFEVFGLFAKVIGNSFPKAPHIVRCWAENALYMLKDGKLGVIRVRPIYGEQASPTLVNGDSKIIL